MSYPDHYSLHRQSQYGQTNKGCPTERSQDGNEGEPANRGRVLLVEEVKELKDVEDVIDYETEGSKPSDPCSKEEHLLEERSPSSRRMNFTGGHQWAWSYHE